MDFAYARYCLNSNSILRVTVFLRVMIKYLISTLQVSNSTRLWLVYFTEFKPFPSAMLLPPILPLNEYLSFYRKLQDRVDKLEAEKDSLVNQVYDLRQLMQRVNQQGERKISQIKSKNVLISKVNNLGFSQNPGRVIKAGFRDIQSQCLSLRKRLLLLELEYQLLLWRWWMLQGFRFKRKLL